MKNLLHLHIIVLLLVTTVTTTLAQTSQGEMWVYRNDGHTEGFRCALIDSITCSRINIDNTPADNFVVQEIWTRDSVCRIPLAAIDSVAFTTPSAVCKPGIYVFAKEFLDYVIEVDSLTIVVGSDCPQALLPAVGDSIAFTSQRTDLPQAFCGIVESVQGGTGAISISCCNVAATEVFDRLYLTFASDIAAYDDSPASARFRRGIADKPVKGILKPITIPINVGVKSNLLPEWIDWAISLDDDYSPSVAFETGTSLTGSYKLTDGHIAGYLSIDNIVPVMGVIYDCSLTITGKSVLDLTLTQMYEVSANMDLPLFNQPIPIPVLSEVGLILYSTGGFSFGVDGKLAFKGNMKATDEHFSMTLNASNNPLHKHNLPSSVSFRPEVKFEPITVAGEVAYRFGAFYEFGAAFVSSNIDKVGVRFDVGTELGIMAAVTPKALSDRLNKTDVFHELSENCGWAVRPYFGISLVSKAGAFEGSLPWEIPQEWLPSYDSGFMPTFSNIGIDDDCQLTASVDGNVFPAIPVGFIVLENGGNVVYKGYNNTKYLRFNDKTSFSNYNLPLNDAVKLTQSYTAYPAVKLFGMDNFEMLAEPKIEIAALSPHTGEAADITACGAKLHGTLEGRVTLLHERCTYGFVYSTDRERLDSRNAELVNASLDDKANMTASASNLVGGTKYYYRAFLADDNDYSYGDIEEFTTLLPVEIKTATLADAIFWPRHYSANEVVYDICYMATTTVELTNSRGVSDWGYVCVNDDGTQSVYSCNGKGMIVLDIQAYYSNEPQTTITLRPYVRYSGKDDIIMGEPQQFELTYPNTDLSLELTGCEHTVEMAGLAEYDGKTYAHSAIIRLRYAAKGAYYQHLKAATSGSGWNDWNLSIQPETQGARTADDDANVLNLYLYYNDKALDGQFYIHLTANDTLVTTGYVTLAHDGRQFTTCTLLNARELPAAEDCWNSELYYIDEATVTGELVYSIETTGGSEVMHARYDTENRLTEWFCRPDGLFEVEYDGDGNPIRITTDDGDLVFNSINTDRAGRITSMSGNDGTFITFTYDSEGHMTSVSPLNWKMIWEDGNLTKVVDGSKTYTFTYGEQANSSSQYIYTAIPAVDYFPMSTNLFGKPMRLLPTAVTGSENCNYSYRLEHGESVIEQTIISGSTKMTIRYSYFSN